MHNFRSDEAAFKVGVDDSSRGGSFVTGIDRPGTCFLHARGEIGAQTKQMIDAADESGYAAIADAHVGEKCLCFFGIEIDEFFFNAR